MNKKAIWIITSILLAYFVFTSGLYYWASGCDVTDKLITPFSWALSAKERGFTPIATKSDMDCIRWIIDNGDTELAVARDSNGAFLMIGWMKIATGASYDRARSTGKVVGFADIKATPNCYIFITDWNSRNGKYTYCSDVGLRKHYPFCIEKVKNGYILTYEYVSNVPQSILMGEVYRSGNSVVYERLTSK